MESSDGIDNVDAIKSSISPIHRQSFWLRRMTTSNSEYTQEKARRIAARKIADRDHTVVVPAFKRAPASLWIGYSYQLYPVSGKFQITVRLTGLLPDRLQNDRNTNIYLRMRLLQGDQQKQVPDVCIIRRGKQSTASTVCFNNQTIENLGNTDIQFTAYFSKGRLLKRKEIITSWTASIDKSKVLRSHCDWKNIKNL